MNKHANPQENSGSSTAVKAKPLSKHSTASAKGVNDETSRIEEETPSKPSQLALPYELNKREIVAAMRSLKTLLGNPCCDAKDSLNLIKILKKVEAHAQHANLDPIQIEQLDEAQKNSSRGAN